MKVPGQVVILNGAPRSGKSSIAREVQSTFPGLWINLGVDEQARWLPEAYLPGIGLRPRDPQFDRTPPGRVSPGELEELVPVLLAALYDSIAAHARLGLSVVVDVGHHDKYSKPLGILQDCARRLGGLPVLFVGVLCPVDEVWRRREATWGQLRTEVSDGVLAAVDLWQQEVHAHGGYDLEVDTSVLRPNECAEVIRKRLVEGPPGSRFEELAGTPTPKASTGAWALSLPVRSPPSPTSRAQAEDRATRSGGYEVTIEGVDHVQLAMPEGREDEARAFYGGLLGLSEVPKPAELAKRGGAWFEGGSAVIHLGVEADFRPAKKAHPALVVSGLRDLVARLEEAGVTAVEDDLLPGWDRVYISDPFGNRIELMEQSS